MMFTIDACAEDMKMKVFGSIGGRPSGRILGEWRVGSMDFLGLYVPTGFRQMNDSVFLTILL